MSAARKYNDFSAKTNLDLSSAYARHHAFSTALMFVSFSDNAEEGKGEKDGKSDGKNGSVKVGEMQKGNTPLEFTILRLIRKGRPKEAIRLIQKALELARNPKVVAKILGVAHVAKQEIIYMQFSVDEGGLAELENTVLNFNMQCGTDMHRNQHLVIDYDLFTSASIPRSRMKATASAGSWQHKLSSAHTTYSYGDEGRERTFNRLAHAADEAPKSPFVFSGMSVSKGADDYEAFKASMEDAADHNAGTPMFDFDMVARLHDRGMNIANVLLSDGLNSDSEIVEALRDELAEGFVAQMTYEASFDHSHLSVSDSFEEEKTYTKSEAYDVGQAPMVVSYDAHKGQDVSAEASKENENKAETMLAVFDRAIETGDIDQAIDSIKDVMPKEQFKAVVEALHILAGDDEPSGPITTFSAVQRAQLGLRSSFTDSVSVKQKAMGVVLQALLTAHDKDGEAPRKAVDLSKLDIA